jgi:4-amino-4-deoxy-L-arabinose transferase-like glycosyltransferase
MRAVVAARGQGASSPAAPRNDILSLAALALVLAVAGFLRFYRLDALPLGFHHDEALDALSALEVWTKGQHPIFFPQQGSREPLMIYLESLSILALGPSRMAARLAQACVGTAGVAAAWWLVRSMFGRRVALLASAFMAVSFWQMFESRLGLRAISQPLVETLCLWFAWRTFNPARLAEFGKEPKNGHSVNPVMRQWRRWRDPLLAGALLGLSLYTYTAARVLPLLLVALLAWQLALSPGFAAKQQWDRMLLLAGASVLVAAPLGVYAVRNPNDFFGRSLQVNLLSPEPFTGAASSGGVGQAVLRTLGMFSVQGDPEWKYNIGGLPVFDWPVSALFYAGILLAALRTASYLRTPRSRRVPAEPHAFLLLWLPIMLLPGFLSSEAPHFLRTIGVIPAVFVFPALTLDWVLEVLARGAIAWAWALVAGLLAGEGVQTGYRYFVEWAHAPDAYYAMQADAAGVARTLARLQPAEPILFSSEYPGHPTLNYLAPRQFAQIRWFNGREGLALPPPGQPYLYVFTAHYQPPFADVSKLFADGQQVAEGRDPAGGIAYTIYRTANPPSLRPATAVSATLGNLAQLEGVTAPAAVTAGSSFEVQEFWQALAPGNAAIRAFLHLVDAQGHVWAQADNLGYYAEDWRPGDQVINDERLEVPADAPPVPMGLLFGLYSASTGQQLPVAGTGGGTQVALGSVQVLPGAGPAPGWRPPHAMDRQLAPGLALAGFDLPRTAVRAGDSLPVTLWWRVSAPPPSVPALQLAGVEGVSERGLEDLLPAAQWPAGVIQDRRELTIPPTARAASAALTIGGVPLAEIAVSQLLREFQMPPLQHRLGVPAGDFATLAGYDLQPVQPGSPLDLTLVWQDRTPASTSYKVFVHVLDGKSDVLAQRDDFPQSGAMPTTFWVPGQVIADHYQVPLPASLPAGAQLEVGMYDPASGKRVPFGPEDRVLLPLGG